ncbi:MAG: hypothetical protein ACR652_00810 [Methylocystis sp.]|uniref:hypothetical protein n=1 Tax=Methylocystis sp. TaxID=1911079 RepID=UPI003DA3AF5D
MSTVYEIATKISMVNGVSGVLAVIAKDALKVEGSINSLQGSLASLNKISASVVGGLAAIGGVAVLSAFKNVAEHGEKLLDQQFKLRNLGVEQNEILKMQADYFKSISKAVPTSTVDEYLKTIRELRAVTGGDAAGLAAAARMAPKAMMMNELLGNEMGTKAGDEYYKLLRSGEMKGIATDPKKREAFIDEAYKYIAGFGGKLTADDFQVLARRGGAAWMNAKPEALGPLAVLAADLGGSGAGTTLMTLQQLQTGAMTLSKQQGDVLAKLGLLDMSKTTKTGFGGGRLQVEPGGIKGSLAYTGNLPGWIQDVIYPALQKAAGGDEGLIENMISKLAPNRNASKLIHMFGDAGFRDQIAKDLGIAGSVRDIERGYGDYAANNPVGVKKAFHSQYESMMQAIGAPAMQAALPVMKATTEMFTKIGAFANANPRLFENLAKGLAELGSAAIVGGLGMMVAGPAGGLIGALAGSLGALAALNWDAMKSSIPGVTADLGKFVTGFADFGTKLADLFDKLLWRLGLWLSSAWQIVNKWLPGGGGSYADAAARMRGMHSLSWMSGVGGGKLGFGLKGPAGTGSGGDMKGLIDQEAARAGIDPRLMYGIVAGESLHGNHFDIGDGGRSHGPFQLYTGGGLGNAFEKQTGLSVRDPANMRAMARFTAEHIRRTGDMSPWHGFHGRRDWNPSWGNMGYSPSREVGPPPKSGKQVQVHTDIHLDGRKIAQAVTHHVAQLHEHSRQSPYFSGTGMFAGPDGHFAVG